MKRPPPESPQKNAADYGTLKRKTSKKTLPGMRKACK